MPEERATIFISYAHEDKAYLDLLLRVLRPAMKGQQIEVWSDREIETGDDWKARILTAIAAARAAVLLVSNDFFCSKFITETELPALLPRVQRNEVKLFILLITDIPQTSFLVDLPHGGQAREFNLASIQAFNSPSQALKGLSELEQEKLFCKLANQLCGLSAGITSPTALAEAADERHSPLPPAQSPTTTSGADPRLLAHLVDRQEQDAELDRLIAGFRQGTLTVIVQGCHGDCVEDYLDRIHWHRPEQRFSAPVDFRWLQKLPPNHLDDECYADTMRRLVAEEFNEFHLNSSVSNAEVARQLATRPGTAKTLILSAALYVDAAYTEPERQIARFTRFWCSQAALPAERRLLVFLGVIDLDGGARRRGWTAMLSPARLFRQGGESRLDRLRHAAEQARLDADACALLPDLGCIRHGHCREWLNCREVRGVICRVDALQGTIKAYFDALGASDRSCVPMRDIAERLEGWLQPESPPLV